jgi:hypothetical protein
MITFTKGRSSPASGARRGTATSTDAPAQVLPRERSETGEVSPLGRRRGKRACGLAGALFGRPPPPSSLRVHLPRPAGEDLSLNSTLVTNAATSPAQRERTEISEKLG